jgi:CubicO group peptidase (beta-lactamase class C family)
LDGVAPANSAPVRVDKVPGGSFHYSGGGMIVAQQLVTDSSGQPIASFIKEAVLDPLGMKHSSYEQPMPTSLEHNAASAHNGAGVPIKGRWNVYPEQVAAGLWTTPSDLALFAIELQKSRAGASNKVLSKAMTTEMLTRSKSSPFGLGVVVSAPNKVPSFNHSGANEGFRTQLFAYTETGKGAVVMTNGDEGGEVIAELMRSLAKEYGWSDYQVTEKATPVVNAKTLATYAGDYLIKGTRAELMVEGSRLFIKTAPLGAGAIELFPETATSFFMLTSPTLLSFVQNESGVVSMEVTIKGQTTTAPRVN